MALAVNAGKQVSQFSDPLSVTAHFVSKALENTTVELHVNLLSEGKTTSTMDISLLQKDQLKCKFLATFGNLHSKPPNAFRHVRDSGPIMPAPEDCVDVSTIVRKHMGDKLRIAYLFDSRVPTTNEFTSSILKGKVGTTASYECWVRFADYRPICLPSVALILDAFPPPVCIVAPSNWVPTLEYTVHFWNTPSPGDDDGSKFVRLKFDTLHCENSVLETTGELWSADGTRLLGKSKQLARVLIPREPAVKDQAGFLGGV